MIPGLNFQRNDRNTDQFAAVILSDKKLDQINELRLRKGIINVLHITIIFTSLRLVSQLEHNIILGTYTNVIQIHIMVNW